MKNLLSAAMLFAAFATTALAGGPLQLTSTDGKPVAIALEGKTTVLLFISTQCPVSNDYNTRMAALHKEFAPKGVQFVFANANSTESAADVFQHAKDKGFTFAVYKDPDNKLADKLSAQVTPEAFVYNAKGELAYHGSVDDSRAEARVTKQPLKDAIAAVLAGKAPAVAESKAFGCTIKRAKSASE